MGIAPRYAHGVSLDRSMIADVRSLSDPELRRLVILAQDLLERRGARRVPPRAQNTHPRGEGGCGQGNTSPRPPRPPWYSHRRGGGRPPARPPPSPPEGAPPPRR